MGLANVMGRVHTMPGVCGNGHVIVAVEYYGADDPEGEREYRPKGVSRKFRYGWGRPKELFSKGRDPRLHLHRNPRLQLLLQGCEFDVDDLTKLTTHDLGHGMLALIDCERRCVIYHGKVDASPILERVVFAVTCAKGVERRFVCSSARVVVKQRRCRIGRV